LSKEKVVAGSVYINIQGPKNKMTTMIREMQVERAFLLPSVLWFLRECRMITQENISMTKLTVQMISLLDTRNKLIT
jgi:hypothetical protein